MALSFIERKSREVRVIEQCTTFKARESLGQELWPGLYKMLDSGAFAEMEPKLQSEVMFTFVEIISFTNAVYQLWKDDIKG